MAFRDEAKRDVARRDPTADHHHGLVGTRPPVEVRIEDMVQTRVAGYRPVRPPGLFARTDGQHEVGGPRRRAAGQPDLDAVAVDLAPRGAILDVKIRESEVTRHAIAMIVEEREGRPFEGCREETGFSMFPGPRELLEGQGGEIEMVHRRRSQVVHPGRRRAGAPAVEESVGGIDDAEAIRGDPGITEQSRGDVRAVDSAADDQPVEAHVRHPSRGRGVTPRPRVHPPPDGGASIVPVEVEKKWVIRGFICSAAPRVQWVDPSGDAISHGGNGSSKRIQDSGPLTISSSVTNAASRTASVSSRSMSTPMKTIS